MTPYTTAPALGQAWLSDLHRQAQRAALARTVVRARRAQRKSAHPGRGVLTVLTGWARRPRPEHESL